MFFYIFYILLYTTSIHSQSYFTDVSVVEPLSPCNCLQMAADVRNADTSDLESCSFPESARDTDALSIYSSSSNRSSVLTPSYLIVQKQMQDVILTQKAAVEQLVKSNIEVLSASKESFNTTVHSQEEKIRQLEQSIVDEYVPKKVHQSLRKELQENHVPKEMCENLQIQLSREYEQHCQTQAKLKDVLDKLDESVSQIMAMKAEMAQDKDTFSSVCDNLREEISEVQARNRDLEARLNEKSQVCHRQQEQIQQQQEQIQKLQQKQENQMIKYKQKMTETEVEKQQEAYLNRMLSGVDKKSKR